MGKIFDWIDAHPRQTLAIAAVVGLVGFLDSAWSIADRIEGGIDVLSILGVARLLTGPVALGLVLLMLWRFRRGNPSTAGGTLTTRHVDSDEARWKKAAVTFLTWLYRRDEWHGLSREAQRAESVPLSDEPGDYARQRLDHAGLEGLGYERRLDIGPEPWWDPPPLTGPEGGWDAHDFPQILEVTSDWLPDPRDLTTTVIAERDLDAAASRAVDVATRQLAPDANVEFRALRLNSAPNVVFDVWSQAADRHGEIRVSEFNVELGEMFPGPPLGRDEWGRIPQPHPWTEDPQWRELIQQLGYRWRPRFTDVTLSHFPWIVSQGEGADSAWHAEVAADDRRAMYILRRGVLAETEFPLG